MPISLETAATKCRLPPARLHCRYVEFELKGLEGNSKKQETLVELHVTGKGKSHENLHISWFLILVYLTLLTAYEIE